MPSDGQEANDTASAAVTANREAPRRTPVQEEAPALITTGFPQQPPASPVSAELPELPKPKPGNVVLATTRPMGSLTLPPLEEGGPVIVIAAEGTEVDEATAQRARDAARTAGFTLREA